MIECIKNKFIFTMFFCSIVFIAFYCNAGVKEGSDDVDQYEKEQEMMRIERFRENVRRDGDTLYLKTALGEYLAFKDTQDCDPLSWCSYEFIDYYKDSGFYLLGVGTIELLDYMMISEKDGKEYLVMEPPIFSPDKKRIVSVIASDYADVSGVFIWLFQNGKLISELSYKPSSKGLNNNYYYFKRWKDNETIEVYKQSLTNKNLCPNSNHVKIELSIRLEGSAWNVYEGSVNCNSKWGRRP